MLVLVLAGFSYPLLSQNATFYKDLSARGGVDPVVKKASQGIYNNYRILDSLLYFTNTLESAVLKGRPAGNITPELVKTAQKKYPGTSYDALTRRLKLYETGKK